MQLSPGTRFGSYEIKHRLGAGGMGEVYFARDVKLGRHVAIKILLPTVTGDEDRVRRFKQEARATSALNHPNILTIFEIGEVDSSYFLVTEYIDGVTLREYLRKQKPTIHEMLDISIQVAGALATAHASAIIHRDIKPENIMQRSDGYIKVLDFGLAKLLPGYGQRETDGEFDTVLNLTTDPTTIVGTVTYMSPEQIRGLNIDGQADIWSLGVVMYEMIAGQPPFSGATKSDIIASILREEPPPLTRFVETPPELHHIIEKSLRKSREDRYQTARDLLIDLRDLKQDLAAGLRIDRIRATSSGARPAGTTVPSASEARTERLSTSKIQSGRATSGVASFIDEVKRHRVVATVLVSLLVMLLLLGGVWVGMKRWRPAQQPPRTQSLHVTEIVTTSDVKEAAISPDGKYIAAVVMDAGKQSIIVQPTANPSQLLRIVDANEEYRGLVFARDGYSIYYLARGEQEQSLYQVALLGGTPRKLIDRVTTPISLSPDGARLAFIRRKEGTTVLMIANADGTAERELARSPANSQFGTIGQLNNAPAWSPDGQVIACPTISSIDAMRVVAVNVHDGAVSPIGSRKFFLIGQLGWIKEGTGLLLAAQEEMPPKSNPQIWFLEYPTGEARNLTNDENYYYGMSLTGDSTALVTTRLSQTSQIWIVSDFPSPTAHPVPASKNKGLGGLVWASDERVLYSSSESGVPEIWSMEVNGSNSKQITFDRQTNVEPAVATSSGADVVYVSYGKGKPNIWRMDSQGKYPKQLTTGNYEDWPDVSPDGRWIVYAASQGFDSRIWKLASDGGDAVRLTEKIARSPVFSPDGKRIACFVRSQDKWQLAVLSPDDGEIEKAFEVPMSVAEHWHSPRWKPDGQALTYIVTRGGVSNIWSQPLNGASPQQLTQFNQDEIFAFAWSPSSKLACVRGANTKTAVLIKNMR